jgi:hypothetical protein
VTPYAPPVSAKLPAPAADVVFRDMNGQAVLVNLGTNRIYSLNATGARFWSLLVEGATREAAEERLLDEFEVGPKELRSEMSDLLRALRAEGLVE